MSKAFKYILGAAITVVLIVAIWYFAKRGKDTTEGGQQVDVPPPPPNQPDNILSREIGDGKLLFDTYLSKFSKSSADLQKALEGIDPLSIFYGTESKVFLTPFLGTAQTIPLILNGNAVNALKAGTLLQLNGNEDLWVGVSAVRGANYKVRDTTGVNLLSGGPDDDSNKFVDLACTYVNGCPSNDKKRNEKVIGGNGIAKFGNDYAKICKNWLNLASVANDKLIEYTLAKLNAAGYQIV